MADSTNYKDFSLEEGRVLALRVYQWRTIKDSIDKARRAPIELQRSYAITWKPYGKPSYGFKLVVLEVDRALW